MVTVIFGSTLVCFLNRIGEYDMIVTKIEWLDKKKAKIDVDYEYAFLLYSSDIRKYRIAEDEPVSEADFTEIVEDTIFRRAKQKALAILKYMDRTEYELRSKLKQAYYTDEIVERTIEYVNAYHYLDDKRYAENYIASKSKSKSKRQIQMELQRKGIEKNLMNDSFEQGNVSDRDTIERLIRKKTSNPEELTIPEKQKLVASLCRKGFAYDDVIKNFTIEL